MSAGLNLEIHHKDVRLEKSLNEETIIEKCDRFREEGKKFLSTTESAKAEEERFYAGEQFAVKDSDSRVKNHVFQVVESEIPLLMDPMPATDILAHDEENYGDHAIVLKAAKNHVYRQQNIFLKMTQMVRSSLKTGSGFLYVDYDHEGEKGEGSVTVKVLSRKQVIKDPAADTLDECRYVIIDSALSNDDLKRRYPKTAEKAMSQKLKDMFVFSSPFGSREDENTGMGGRSYSDRFESKDITYVEEYWIKDYTLESIDPEETEVQITEETAQLHEGKNPDISKWEDHPLHIKAHTEGKDIFLQEALLKMGIQPGMHTEQDIQNLIASAPDIGVTLQIMDDHIEMHNLYLESMDESETGKRPKYPDNLRLVVKTGKIVHFDDAPDVDDGLVPLVEFECYKDEGQAEGVIKNLIPMQKTINEMDALELAGLKVNTNGGWLVDKQSGVDPDTLTNEPGLVVVVENGGQASRLTPGQVSNQLQARGQRDYEAMNRIEGVGETLYGEAPKGDPSGVLMRRLQQSQLGRIRLKSHNLSQAVYRLDCLILSRIMKNWSTERKLRSEDANGSIKFVKFDPRFMRDFTYELSMPEGSMLSEDKEMINQTYKDMLDKGQIDLKTYATLADLPKKAQLIRILGEQDQAKAAIQDLQMQVQEAQKAALMTKANLAPHLLTPEEIGVVQEFAAQEQAAALTTNPMAVAPGDQARGPNEIPEQI